MQKPILQQSRKRKQQRKTICRKYRIKPIRKRKNFVTEREKYKTDYKDRTFAKEKRLIRAEISEKGLRGIRGSLFYKNLKLFEITLNYQSLCGMVVSGKMGERNR